MKALYLPHPVSHLNESWGTTVIETCGRRHDVRVFDPQKPGSHQFEGIKAVLDLGGNARRPVIDLAAAAGVSFMQALTTGLDHVEVEYILGKGIVLCHCPGILSAIPLAEHAMMLMLMLAHRYRESEHNFRNQMLYGPMGTELSGKVLGILGFGATGTELALRAKAFGMKLFAIDVRHIAKRILDEIRPEVIAEPDRLDEMVRDSDYVSLHLHLTPETHHVIDARRISLMKRTACLINVSRGELVDEDALHEALVAGRIGGAGLDAYSQEPPDPNHPVYGLPNVVTTPHTSGATTGTRLRRAEYAAHNLDRLERGEEPLGRVTADWKG